MRKRKGNIILAVFLGVVILITAGVILFVNFGPVGELIGLLNGKIADGKADFSFLSDEGNELPWDIHGHYIDISSDFDLTKDAESLKSDIAYAVDVTATISTDSVFIPVKSDTVLQSDGFDILEYLCSYARQRSRNIFFVFSSSDIINFENRLKTGYKFTDGIIEKYQPDFILIDGICSAGVSENEKDAMTKCINDIKSHFLGISPKLRVGITVPCYLKDSANKAADIQTWMKNSVVDFYVADITLSSSQGCENAVKEWSKTALSTGVRIYALLHNENVAVKSGWSDYDEIYRQIKMTYNYGGICGCIFNSLDSLKNNKNSMTVSVYSYFCAYNDIDYTALDIYKCEITNDKSSVVISGKGSDPYPVCIRNSREVSWRTVIPAAKDGKFQITVPLYNGKNKIMIRHMNAGYEYNITKAVDVLKSCAYSVSDDGKGITFYSSAYEGSTVYAYFNNRYVYLEQLSAPDADGYCTYTADYRFGFRADFSGEDMSFGGVCGGIVETLVPDETPKASVYNDNGLGRADMCLVVRNYSETTPASATDDLSVPLYTPQIDGTYGYIASTAVYENGLLYKMTSGLQIAGKNAEYICNAYKLPENSVALSSAISGATTDISFTLNYKTGTRITVEPQNYFEGYLQRIYNVKACEGEYVDIRFYDAVKCSGTADFSSDPLFSSCEWFTEEGTNALIIRLYLRNKGGFYGYSMTSVGDNTLKFSFKHTAGNYSDYTVVLDAGHGGFGDSGTYAFGNTVYEQAVTLSIALKTKEILENSGINVVMTRNGSEGITLGDRAALARKVNGDVFVSIHCDGISDVSLLGTHTFYYRSYSKLLADDIHTELVSMYRNNFFKDAKSKEYTAVDMGTKFFPYGVTRIEECPAVLVECGYLTNEANMKILSADANQQLFAVAIAQGIVNYLAQR